MLCSIKLAIYLLFVITHRAAPNPSSEFSQHTLIKSKFYDGREKRQISSTREQNGFHINNISIKLEIDNKVMEIDLSLNKGLLAKGFFHRFQENGIDKLHRPNVQDVELCQYNGKVRGVPTSWVALSTCDGLSGVIFDGTETHYIETTSRMLESDLESSIIIYKHQHLIKNNMTCGNGKDQEHAVIPEFVRNKRETLLGSLLRTPYNSNDESKYIELLLVVDNREYKALGSRNAVEQRCKSLVNVINGIYSQLNIFVALVGIVIWTKHDIVEIPTNGGVALSNFMKYNVEKLSEHHYDNVQLLSKVPFKGLVGLAYVGNVCIKSTSCGINIDHSTIIGRVAATMAHEMGHNLGMLHDTSRCACRDSCVMAKVVNAPTHWSSCSTRVINEESVQGRYFCLMNKPLHLFGSPVCGNGFVEEGEQCDCGLTKFCLNKCCNAVTCRFGLNATCATGECCNFTTCKQKPVNTLCRSASSECDLPEYCTDESEYCPQNVFKMDTEPCHGGEAHCYHGECRTKTSVCKSLWGESGRSTGECDQKNVEGTFYGNCGYNSFKRTYIKCLSEDINCGLLHCNTSEDQYLPLGFSTTYNSKGIDQCNKVIQNRGLTPNGAPCGKGKMCVDQKCVSIDSLRLKCPYNCNKQGWCNNLGQCHCKIGYSRPYCERSGHDIFAMALFIIFLGIVPLVALSSWCIIHRKKIHHYEWFKNASTGFGHVLCAIKRSSITEPNISKQLQHSNQPTKIEIEQSALVFTIVAKTRKLSIKHDDEGLNRKYAGHGNSGDSNNSENSKIKPQKNEVGASINPVTSIMRGSNNDVSRIGVKQMVNFYNKT